MNRTLAAILVATATGTVRGQNAAPAATLTPILQAPVAGNSSVVYCPTFQLAWDRLRAVVGEPVLMQNTSPWVPVLNTSRCPAADLPDGAWVAMAGYTGSNIHDAIAAVLAETFGNAAPPPPAPVDGSYMVGYACLQRHLPFSRRFIPFRNRPLTFRGPGGATPVACFGAAGAAAGHHSRQVRIIHFRNDAEFTLQIATGVPGEFTVLARMAPPESLDLAVAAVRGQLEARWQPTRELRTGDRTILFANTLQPGDTLAIPIIDIKLRRQYEQLCGETRTFLNAGYERVFLGVACQDLIFRLDQSGAEIRSSATVDGFAAAAPTPPRRFLFDRPFLVSLWRNGATRPYLALWVNGPDVLAEYRGAPAVRR